MWLQIPTQLMEDEHKPPDRVRLPRSLFASLQSSKPVVRLAISILDIGSGSLFKVRGVQMEAQGSLRFSAWFTMRCLPSVESSLRDG